MSSGSYRQVDVQCPFYKYDDGTKRVTCEGITDDSSISLRFRKKEGWQQHMDIFCCRRYICCEIYRMLMGKYE